MSEARQAAERAAEDSRLLAESAKVVLKYTGLKWAVPDTASLLSHAVAPLLAAKDAEIDRLAEQVERLNAALRKVHYMEEHAYSCNEIHAVIESEIGPSRLRAALTEQPHA